MPDDKSKIKQDRKLVSSEETYEVAAFARKYGIPQSEAQTIIKRYGPSRKKLDNHKAAIALYATVSSDRSGRFGSSSRISSIAAAASFERPSAIAARAASTRRSTRRRRVRCSNCA